MSAATDLLDRCHEVMGIPPIERAAEEAHRESARFSGLVTLESVSVAEAAAATVAAGTGTIPEGTADAFREHDRQMAEYVMLARRFGTLAEQLNATAETARATMADTGLAVLRDELTAVLEEARPVVQRLGAVRDSDAAIAADRVDEWRQLADLAGRRRDVRQAQRQLVWDTRREGGPVLTFEMCGYVQASDRYADVRKYREQHQGPRRAAHSLFMGEREPDVELPWLGDPVDALLFECRADVQPWVPSMSELRAEERAVQERTKPQPDDDAGQGGVKVTAGRDAPLWIRPENAWSRARAAGKQGGF